MTHTMHKYTVLAVLGINPGTVLGLSHQQAGPRAHALKPIEVDDKAKMGSYEVLSRVEFKAGEVIWTAADLNKALATALEPEEKTRQRAADQVRAAAEAKDLAALRAKAKKWDEVEPQLQELRDKAKALDTLQSQLEDVQTRAALWDSLPEAVRADAIKKAEAELLAAADKTKAKK